MRIAIFGGGYVGLSLSILLSRKPKIEVNLYDINKKLIETVNSKISPISDNDISFSLKNNKHNLKAKHINTLDQYYDYYVIATPTDYNEINGYFDTSSVETTIKNVLSSNSDAIIVIKSTIPIGFTDLMKKKYDTEKIFFSPEFLREGKALHDNFYPTRIIVGSNKEPALKFGKLLKMASKMKDVNILTMSSKEAEAVKLFSNAYLALRVSYFNELDTFSINRNLNTMNIIDGVCSDPRIGSDYNNPSFGYGGYCLPKDVKQLSKEVKKAQSPLIKSINQSNESRKKFIAMDILKKVKPKKVVGIFKITMKKDSDNHRTSAILDIIDILKQNDLKIIIYDKTIDKKLFREIKVEKSLEIFKKKSDLIIANRLEKSLKDVYEKVYTRDIYFKN